MTGQGYPGDESGVDEEGDKDHESYTGKGRRVL